MTRRLAVLVVAVVAPLVILAVGILVASLLLSGITDPVAVHWGIDGAADGFAPAWTVVVGMVPLGLLGPLVLGVVLVVSRKEHLPLAPWQKLVAVISLGLVALTVALAIWTLASQSGGDVPPVWPGLALGFGSGLILGVIAWFLMPAGVTPVPAAARPAAPLDLSAGERALWIRSSRLSNPALLVIGIGMLVALAASTWLVVLTDGTGWPILFLPAVLILVLFATSSWTVRVDDSGLLVRSSLGWPAFRIRPGEVEAAGVAAVAPLAEFGGWGLRYAPGRRFGIVLRGGEGLEVRRHDGRTFVVTVDDAATGASLLAAVAARPVPPAASARGTG